MLFSASPFVIQHTFRYDVNDTIYSLGIVKLSPSQYVEKCVKEWFYGENLHPTLVGVEFSSDAIELLIPKEVIAAQGYQIVPRKEPCKVNSTESTLHSGVGMPRQIILQCALYLQIKQSDVLLGECTPMIVLRIISVSSHQTNLQFKLEVTGTVEPCTFQLLVTHSLPQAQQMETTGVITFTCLQVLSQLGLPDCSFFLQIFQH